MLNLLVKFLRDRRAKQLGSGFMPGPDDTEIYSHPDDSHEKTGLVPPLLIALILSLLVLFHLGGH